jgi:HSP20 family protein
MPEYHTGCDKDHVMREPREFSHNILSMFQESFQGSFWRPCTDVYRTRTGWLVKLELAGINPDDVKFSVSENRLHVSGVRRDVLSEDGLEHYSMEISYSAFERTIELPCSVDDCEIRHEFRQGMLLICLTRQES